MIREFFDSAAGEIVIQALGFLAMAMCVLSLQAKHRTSILVMQSIGNFVFVVQLTLMCKYAGAFINAVGMLRNILYALRSKFKFLDTAVLPGAFIMICAASGLYSYQTEGWTAFLPALAMIVACIAFYIKDEFKIRVLSFLISPPWIIYHMLAFNIGGVLSEILSIGSIVIALIRFGSENSGDEDTQHIQINE